MKAVLSNRIYMDCDENLQREIDKELTYRIPSYNPKEPPFVIKNMGIVRKKSNHYSYRQTRLNTFEL